MTTNDANKVQVEPVSANKVQTKWISRFKPMLSYILIFIVLGFALDLWRAQSIASGKAPELIATSVQGKNIDLLAMSQEKPVLVYFWATWCGVCSLVSPSVDLVSDHYQVVTIALTSGEDRRIKQYLNAKDYDFTVLNDPKGVISRDWGISVTPTLLVIDKGEITSVTTGFTSPMGIWARMFF